MDEFLQDLGSGDIQFRDKWQFELKSDFYPKSKDEKNIYTQEFYIFLPNALQINDQTYSKEEFYRNQTNLIRYKTPEFSLDELINPNNFRSPLNRLKLAKGNENEHEMIEDELKLLGNIFRSSLRRNTSNLLAPSPLNAKDINHYCDEIRAFRQDFLNIKNEYIQKTNSAKLNAYFQYIDEFLSTSIDYYLTGFLYEARKRTPAIEKATDDQVCQLIFEEKKHRENLGTLRDEKSSKDEVLYRLGLLKKFVIDALLLTTNRASIQQKFGHYIGAISAGVAMMIYLLLFIWQGQVFLINSQPFIIVTVIAYVLKDRIKDSLKTISYQRALRWFSDYTTEIKSPDEKTSLGILRESFTFVDEDSIPLEILTIRNREFHTILETVKRPEQVLYIKKVLTLFPQQTTERRQALNIIFRLNIQDFLSKASDPYHNYMSLDKQTKELISTKLPKVYHLNVILKNSFIKNGKAVVEYKKFRIIADKNGIKEIEQVKQK